MLPTYNGEQYLAEAIKSCLNQTYKNLEIIIVDDGSTDSTPKICQEFCEKDSRVIYHRNKTNKKLPASLNVGFAKTTGPLLTWTSDDNAYKPQAVETMVEFLKKNPDIDMVYANYDVINEKGSVLYTEFVSKSNEMLRKNLIGPCFLYRREMYEKLGNYDEALFLAEDYDYWLRAYVNCQIEPLNQNLYLYRYHPQSLTFKRHKYALLNTQKALLKIAKSKYATKEQKTDAYLSIFHYAKKRKDIFQVFYYLIILLCSPSVLQKLIIKKTINRLTRS